MSPSLPSLPRLSAWIGAQDAVPPLLAALRDAAGAVSETAGERTEDDGEHRAVRVLDALRPLRPDAEVIAATALHLWPALRAALPPTTLAAHPRVAVLLDGRMQAQAQAAAPAAPAVPDDRRGFRDNDEDGDDIVSSIAGTFRGWSKLGDRFVLTNGQVWEVTDAPTKFAVNVENPTVRIEPGVFSAWYLSIDGYNSRVKVKRIK